MASGRPGDHNPEVEVKEAEPKDPLRSRLEFSAEWSEEPFIPGQEFDYPDTVRNIEKAYRMFDVSSKEDMEEYSKFSLSTEQRMSILITDEERQWHEASGNWRILVHYERRKFKTLKTTSA